MDEPFRNPYLPSNPNLREVTVEVEVTGDSSKPLKIELTDKTPAATGDDNKDPTLAALATWLSGGFVVLTALLTAVGSYTGGVARILRNDGTLLVLAFLGVFVSVVLALIAGELAKSKDKKYTKRKTISLLGAVALFLGAMGLALWAAVSSTTATDRPRLTAQLAVNDTRLWTVKGTATTNGLQTGEQMQVLVYGVPADGAGDDLVRIYFATVGPDQDGLATVTFDSPLPASKVDAVVVTASSGTLPRDCANKTAFYVQSNTVDLKETTQFEDDYRTACVTLATPPPVPTAAASAQ